MTRRRHHTLRLIITLAVLCLPLALPACTKKVVSKRGVYSTEQVPKETQTPILDAIGGTVDTLTGKSNQR